MLIQRVTKEEFLKHFCCFATVKRQMLVFHGSTSSQVLKTWILDEGLWLSLDWPGPELNTEYNNIMIMIGFIFTVSDRKHRNMLNILFLFCSYKVVMHISLVNILSVLKIFTLITSLKWLTVAIFLKWQSWPIMDY